MGFFFDQQAADNLKRYKYAGADTSLIYRFILTPMNDVLIQFFPRWFAPNLITSISLVLTVFSQLLIVYFAPNLSEEAPSWVYALCGILLFVYQTLDNLDGKQAKRTQSSSPLGLLFDHGIDAMNTTVSSLMMAAVLRLGPTWKTFALWSCAVVPFWFATWEEYVTGQLILSVVNGPTEGILMCCTMCFLAAFNGPEFWLAPVTADYRRNDVIVILGVVMVIPTLVNNLMNSYKFERKQHRSPNRVMLRLIPFFLFFGATFLWAYLSPANILRLHPRLFLWSSGLIFFNLVTKLMMAHMCDMEYSLVRKICFPLFFAVVNACSTSWNHGKTWIDEETYLNAYFCFAFGAWLHMVFGVINEITTILNIHAFKIAPPKTH